MSPHKLAHLESARLFSILGRQVAVITGKKPRNTEIPHLVRRSNRELLVACGNLGSPNSFQLDSYVIVQPVDVSADPVGVDVWHAGGSTLIKIEPLAHDSTAETSSVLGVSQDFSLEAAMKDAFARLNPQADPEPRLFEVVSMGALYGGFAGFSRLFVRLSPGETKLVESAEIPYVQAKKRVPYSVNFRAAKP